MAVTMLERHARERQPRIHSSFPLQAAMLSIHSSITSSSPPPPPLLLPPTYALHLHRPNISHHFISSPPPPAATATPQHTLTQKRHLTRMPKPQQHTLPTPPRSNTESRPNPTARLPTSASSAQRRKNPASGARACNLLGATANHLGAPHTLARRASRPTDPGEREKRRRRARLMPSNVSGLPVCQARDQHPSRPPGIPTFVCCPVPSLCVVACRSQLNVNNINTLQPVSFPWLTCACCCKLGTQSSLSR